MTILRQEPGESLAYKLWALWADTLPPDDSLECYVAEITDDGQRIDFRPFGFEGALSLIVISLLMFTVIGNREDPEHSDR